MSIGSSYTDTRDAIPAPTIGSSYTDTKGDSIPAHVMGPVLEHAVTSSPESSMGPILTHPVVSLPERTFSGVSVGVAAVPPTYAFSGVSGGSIPITMGPTFSGVSDGTAAVPPIRYFGGGVGDYVPTLITTGYFGGGVGGSVVYDRITPPENLTATVVNAGCIRLDWEDKSHDEDGFTIERSLTGTGDWVDIGTVDRDVTTFLDRLAVPLVVYDYQVYAFNALEISIPSNTATAVTQLPPGLPTPPPPVTPDDPPRNRIDSDIVDFKSPGPYGLEKDADGDIVGSKF